MKNSSQASPKTENATGASVTAPDMAMVMAGQIAGLRGLTSALEEALSSSLCSCNPLTEEAFVAFQRIDFMRQSLKDIESLLVKFGPNLAWTNEEDISHSSFSNAVDMGKSIDTMFSEDQHDPPVDSVQSGDADLW